MSRHYDVVVVGGNLAATLTAALLGKRGFRGLLIDQGELSTVGARLLSDLVLSDESSAVMEHVHTELGVQDRIAKKVPVHRPMLQAIYPDERVDWHTDPVERQREIRRAFGEHAANALEQAMSVIQHAETETGAFLEEAGELPARGFFNRRASASVKRKHGSVGQSAEDEGALSGLPPELAELFVSLLPFLGHFDALHRKDVSMARLGRLFGRLARGLYTLPDAAALRTAFLEVAEHRAFETIRGAVESVEIGQPLAIRASRQRETITADLLIDASWDLSGVDTISAKQKKKELALTLQNAKPRGFLHTYGLEVDESVLPPGMATHVLLLNGRRDPERYDAADPDSADRAIWLTREPPNDDGRVLLVAQQAVTSVRAHAETSEELEAIMRARILRLVPFLEDGHPARVTVGGSAKRQILTHPLYDPTLDTELGLTGVPMRTDHKRVFLAGPAVLPGLGSEGAYLSALQAADACDTIQNKKKHPKTLAARR